MRFFIIAFIALSFAGIAAAQSDERPRVFIEESDSWEVKSEPIFSSTDKKGRVHIGGGTSSGGAKPRTAEIMKRFAEQCPAVVVTIKKDRADFVVLLEHEGGKDLFNKDNKLAVFDREGDLVTSGAFSRPKKAVEVACNAISAHRIQRSSGDSPTSSN
jgi:hypothetical protein